MLVQAPSANGAGTQPFSLAVHIAGLVELYIPVAQVKTKAEKLAHAEQANADLNTQLSAERRAAKQAGAGAQKQLLGSMRRIQYMVSAFTIASCTRWQKCKSAVYWLYVADSS